MARWAVFDVDGTLVPGASMEVRFLLHSLGGNGIRLRTIGRYLICALQESAISDSLKCNKMYLRGASADLVQRRAGEFFRRRIAPAVSSVGLKTMEEYRRDGYSIMVMTGSPDFLARNVRCLCTVDHLVAAVPAIDGERYTGDTVGLHPYGERKRRILLELGAELEIDFDRSAAFADAGADVLHMELFGEPVAVNPARKLRAVARRRGWRIERWK